ncbi:MAG: hypothetical protein SGCHY_000739 [Lobulomycetales sp.]
MALKHPGLFQDDVFLVDLQRIRDALDTENQQSMSIEDKSPAAVESPEKIPKLLAQHEINQAFAKPKALGKVTSRHANCQGQGIEKEEAEKLEDTSRECKPLSLHAAVSEEIEDVIVEENLYLPPKRTNPPVQDYVALTEQKVFEWAVKKKALKPAKKASASPKRKKGRKKPALKLELLSDTPLSHIYKEWYHGLDGKPSIEEMNKLYGNTWRTGPAYTARYRYRRSIILEIELRLGKGNKNLDEVLADLERERKNRSIGTFALDLSAARKKSRRRALKTSKRDSLAKLG